MTAEVVLAVFGLLLVAAFLCGEQYGRRQERKVRERMRRTRTHRDVAWDDAYLAHVRSDDPENDPVVEAAFARARGVAS